MLSPDNFIADGGFTQDYNRYTYARNNPLVYTDPDGNFAFFIIPTIGWSKSGGLSIGIMAGVGFAGGLSAQVGIGYSFKNKDLSVYAGASFAFNSVYAAYSFSGGASVGYTFGLSMFSGTPVSSNFATVGVNYSFSNNSLSGNVSAWQVDRNGVTFDPSVSVAVFSERTTNLVRGEGFRNNNQVLYDYVRHGNYQGALDYFGFEGTYDPNVKSQNFQASNYWGAFDSSSGQVTYGYLAFKDYATLRASFIKEYYHSSKFKKGLSIEQVPGEIRGMGMDTYLEEVLGYVFAYKRQGLFSGHSFPFKGMN